ncbi:MAG: hypothetical protein RBU21_16845, partial [FCB group bacterium]|nr:hypothetical protein [FCB group bacterium]
MKMSLAKGRAARVAVGLRKGVVLGLVLAVSVCVESAHAFYPLGIFGPDGNLIIVKWPLREMDTNGDGDVQQGEGVPLIFETGEWGFSDDEIDTVLAGFQTWQNVPTAYVGFRLLDTTPDPLELSEDIGSVDFLNYVAFEFNGDGSEDPEVLPDNVGGLALVTFALVDSFVTVDGLSYPVSGG